MYKKILLFWVSVMCFSLVFSQENTQNQIVRDNIETVLLYKESSEIAYPIFFLGEEEKLTLSFDEVDENQEQKDYQYTIIHCDADWEVSDLMFSEYIDGFEENEIDDIDAGFSTFTKYVNYQVTFPNDYIEFLISGNYIIKIYEDYDIENVVLIKRFYVGEKLLNIEATVKQATIPSLMDTYHEIDFTIDYSDYKIDNVIKDLKVNILQNNRYDNAIIELKPKYINNNVLEYNYDFENTFCACNEFRYFDAKKLKFGNDKILSIDFYDNIYHIILREEKIRSTEPFLFNKDINGLRLINSTNSIDQSTDADYCYVQFNLQKEVPFIEGDVYIFSEFTNWKCDEKYKMIYNSDLKQYEKSIVLKQGFYNYYFALKTNDKISTDLTEGNFYQTENDYIIFVYHFDSDLRYDRLISVKICSSGQ